MDILFLQETLIQEAFNRIVNLPAYKYYGSPMQAGPGLRGVGIIMKEGLAGLGVTIDVIAPS